MAKGFKTGGRKAGTLNKATADVRALAQQYAPEAVDELARLSTEADSESARVAAIKELLDRSYGRAKQAMELSADAGTMAGAIAAAAEAVDAKLSQLIERKEVELIEESLQVTNPNRTAG